MSWVMGFFLLAPVLQEEFDATPGPRTVRLAGSYSRIKSTSRALVRDAVQLLGVEGAFAKVRIAEGEVYLPKTSVGSAEAYQKEKGPANEKELMAMKAEGFEAGRFDPETEGKLKELRPNLGQAYDAVDRLEKRLKWTASRSSLSARLEAFLKEGGLAEFGTVK
jgi:hypothetical protein